MTKRIARAVLLTGACLAAAAGSAMAQEQVTVVRRGGARVAGRIEGWNRQTDTVYIRVSQPDQQKFPMADVLVMDVGGSAQNLPAAELAAARGADHVLVTRGGEILRGRLTGIDGGQGSDRESEPRTVSFMVGGTERRFKMTDVARLYLGNYPR